MAPGPIHSIIHQDCLLDDQGTLQPEADRTSGYSDIRHRRHLPSSIDRQQPRQPSTIAHSALVATRVDPPTRGSGAPRDTMISTPVRSRSERRHVAQARSALSLTLWRIRSVGVSRRMRVKAPSHTPVRRPGLSPVPTSLHWKHASPREARGFQCSTKVRVDKARISPADVAHRGRA